MIVLALFQLIEIVKLAIVIHYIHLIARFLTEIEILNSFHFEINKLTKNT